MREGLSNELIELINELGPQLWEDFDHVRVYVSVAKACLDRTSCSGEFLFLLLVYLLRLANLDFGDVKVAWVQWTHKEVFLPIRW